MNSQEKLEEKKCNDRAHSLNTPWDPDKEMEAMN